MSTSETHTFNRCTAKMPLATPERIEFYSLWLSFNRCTARKALQLTNPSNYDCTVLVPQSLGREKGNCNIARAGAGIKWKHYFQSPVREKGNCNCEGERIIQILSELSIA
jgi:hypothetical protein